MSTGWWISRSYAVEDRLSTMDVGTVELVDDDIASEESKESIADAGEISFCFTDEVDCCNPVAFRAALSIASSAARTSFSAGIDRSC